MTTLLMAIGLTLMILAVILNVIGLIRTNKGFTTSKSHYRTYMIAVMLIIPLELITAQWFNTIIWSIILVMTIRRLNRMGLDIWE